MEPAPIQQATEPVHGDFPDRPATPLERIRSGIVAASALALLGATLLVGAIMPYAQGMNDPLAPWFVASLYIGGALFALLGSALELRRARRAETFMMVGVMIGVLLTWASVTNGWYWYAPLLVGATLFAILALANRAISRDELRHVSRDDTSDEGRGPTPDHAGPEHTATRRV